MKVTAIMILGGAAFIYCAAYFVYCLGRGPARDAIGAAVLCLINAAAVLFLSVC